MCRVCSRPLTAEEFAAKLNDYMKLQEPDLSVSHHTEVPPLINNNSDSLHNHTAAAAAAATTITTTTDNDASDAEVKRTKSDKIPSIPFTSVKKSDLLHPPRLELYDIDFEAAKSALNKKFSRDFESMLPSIQSKLEQFQSSIFAADESHWRVQHLQPMMKLFLEDILKGFNLHFGCRDATHDLLQFSTKSSKGSDVTLTGHSDLFVMTRFAQYTRRSNRYPPLEPVLIRSHWELKPSFGEMSKRSSTVNRSVRTQHVLQCAALMQRQGEGSCLVGIATDMVAAFLTLSFVDGDGSVYHLTTRRYFDAASVVILYFLSLLDPAAVNWNTIFKPKAGRPTAGLDAYYVYHHEVEPPTRKKVLKQRQRLVLKKWRETPLSPGPVRQAVTKKKVTFGVDCVFDCVYPQIQLNEMDKENVNDVNGAVTKN